MVFLAPFIVKEPLIQYWLMSQSIIVLSQNFPKNMFNDKKQHKPTKKISEKPYLKKMSLT